MPAAHRLSRAVGRPGRVRDGPVWPRNRSPGTPGGGSPRAAGRPPGGESPRSPPSRPCRRSARHAGRSGDGSPRRAAARLTVVRGPAGRRVASPRGRRHRGRAAGRRAMPGVRVTVPAAGDGASDGWCVAPPGGGWRVPTAAAAVPHAGAPCRAVGWTVPAAPASDRRCVRPVGRPSGEATRRPPARPGSGGSGQRRVRAAAGPRAVPGARVTGAWPRASRLTHRLAGAGFRKPRG